MHQGRAFLHNPHAGMFVSMNVTFVSLRLAKPTFQVKVVARHIGVITPHEQPYLKTRHDCAHLPLNQIIAGPQLVSQDFKSLLAYATGTANWLQRFLNRPYRSDMTLDGLQIVRDLVQSSINASCQTPQLAFSSPPFFRWRFRSSDCRTSRSASAIRRPGGCSGPPWSSLRIPLTAVQ